MKKKLYVLLGAAMLIALVGCGKEKKTEKYEIETSDGKVTIEVTEEKKEEESTLAEVVYEEGKVPYGKYVYEPSKYLNFVDEGGTNSGGIYSLRVKNEGYEYNYETKMYTIKYTGGYANAVYIMNFYIDEENNYNIIVKDIYESARLVKEPTATEVNMDDYLNLDDIEKGNYNQERSQVDVNWVYERQ